MKINNLQVYDLAETIIASGYPKSVSADNDLLLKEIKKTINNKTLFTNTNSNIESAVKRIKTLGNSINGHDQFLTGILVSFDLTFSNKAWIEAERYKFLNFVSSQSTMHKICEFDLNNQYNSYVDKRIVSIVEEKVKEYNKLSIELGNMKKDNNIDKDKISSIQKLMKEKYLEILYNNPAGFLITARVTTNYRCLKNIYTQRHNHRLPEWRDFCNYIKQEIPYFKELCLKEY